MTCGEPVVAHGACGAHGEGSEPRLHGRVLLSHAHGIAAFLIGQDLESWHHELPVLAALYILRRAHHHGVGSGLFWGEATPDVLEM